MPQLVSDRVRKTVCEITDAVSRAFTSDNVSILGKIVTVITQALKNGNTLFLCGNGGSAADCQHVAAEFIGRFKEERASYPAIALTTDTSILTAVANDYSFDVIFSRQIEGLGKPGDVLIGISTSGNSSNVINAIKAARARGMTTIGLSGNNGGKLKDAVDIAFLVPSSNTPTIQAGHSIALHVVCEVTEKELCAR